MAAEWEEAVRLLKEHPEIELRLESTEPGGMWIQEWSKAHPEKS